MPKPTRPFHDKRQKALNKILNDDKANWDADPNLQN